MEVNLSVHVAEYYYTETLLSIVCCSSVTKYIWLFVTSWTAVHQAPLSSIISQSLLKLMSIESVMPSNHCCPLLLCSVFSSIRIFSRIRIFSNELAPCIRWPKYWSFSFSISLSNENSGLISFMVDWFDLLAVLGTPKSLLQVQNITFGNCSFGKGTIGLEIIRFRPQKRFLLSFISVSLLYT